MKGKQRCAYSVPNVWITANLIHDWVSIGGELGIGMSQLVQVTTKLVVTRNYESFMQNLTEDLLGIILYAHGYSGPTVTYDKTYYAGDIQALTEDGGTVIYRQLDLMADIMRATKGRRIAEAHLMQCYSFKDPYIIGKWRETAVISKGYTRANVCGINLIFT